MEAEPKIYRVKYWRWINQESGEWAQTGLMTKDMADMVAESLHQSNEMVSVFNSQEEDK